MKTSVRYFRGLCQFLILLAITGCSLIEQGMNDCPTTTTILFTYKSDKGNEILTDYITSVDAFIFDSEEMMVRHRKFTSSELRAFSGWHVDDLPPGEYYVVCWGNVGDNSRMTDFSRDILPFSDFIIRIHPDVTTSGEQIYYAPDMKHPHSAEGVATKVQSTTLTEHYFKVVAYADNIKEMPFVRAHRTINVYVVDPCEEPEWWIQGTKLASEYDFYYRTRDVFRTFTQEAKEITTLLGDKAYLSTFHVGYSEIKNDIDFILLEGQGGREIVKVNLKKFLEDNPSAFGNTIDILITLCDCLPFTDDNFLDLGVSISIPMWNFTPIVPKP